MFYVRTNKSVGRRGYRYIGPFPTRSAAVAHSILAFPHEVVSDSRVEEWTESQIRANAEEGECVFVRPNSRQIDKHWHGDLNHARRFAAEESARFS